MTEDEAPATGRAQDAGRSHHKRGQPSPATTALLAQYHEAMRGELTEVLRELTGRPPDGVPPQLALDGTVPPPKRPSLKDRAALWDLGVKLARELGSSIDPAPDRDAAGKPATRGPARLKRGDT